MAMNWGNDPDAPKVKREEPKKDNTTLFYAALGVSLIYALVLGGGSWLRTFVKKSPTATQANPVPVPNHKAE